jgi:hypothetical protein
MIGYNRTVKLRWLHETVDMFLAGMSDADIYEALRDRLKDELSVGSAAQWGSREKTITLLLRTWVRVPPPMRALREDGVLLRQGVRRSERLPFLCLIARAVSICLPSGASSTILPPRAIC